MAAALFFDQRESTALVENFHNQDYNQFSCVVIRKVLQTRQYYENEPLVVNALMEVMSNVLDQFKQAEISQEDVLQLSDALYNLLLQVECVEAD